MDYNKVFLRGLIPKVGGAVAFLNFQSTVEDDLDPVLVLFRFPDKSFPVYVELMSVEEEAEWRASDPAYGIAHAAWDGVLERIHEDVVAPSTPDGWSYEFAQYVTGLYLVPKKLT